MSAAIPPNQDRSVSIGGSIIGGVIQTGDANTASVQFQQAAAFEDAQEELKKPEPNKDEVGQAIDRALNYAQKANGFVEAIDKLRPHVTNAAAWLGENWYKLLSLVGLTV